MVNVTFTHPTTQSNEMVSLVDTAISLHIPFATVPRPTQPKVPRSIQMCIFGVGGVLGAGGVQTNIPEILEWGHSRNFKPRFLANGMCSASQIVSYILRVWRLINEKFVLSNFTFDECSTQTA